MRWCILPAHTHSQIRLDLHESNAKSADPRAPERAHGHGKIGILAKEQVYNVQQRQKPTQTGHPLPHKTNGADPRGRASQLTHKSKQSCPGSRACNPARSNILQYTSTHTRAHTHDIYNIQVYNSIHYFIHCKSTLIYTIITHATDM